MAKKGLKRQLEVAKAVAATEKPKNTKKGGKPVKDVELEEDVSESEEEEVAPPATELEVDFSKNTLSKKEQRKLKKKLLKLQEEIAQEEDDEDEQALDLEKLARSDSESDINGEESEDESSEDEDEDEEDPEAGEDEEAEASDVPLSDVELDEDADVVPHHKLTIDNQTALKQALARIELPWAKHAFTEHLSVTGDESTEKGIKDIYDDTERELAFYKQGLEAVKQSRDTLRKLNVPFSRPLDYFAEMVKSDNHMQKLKQKLLTEAANKKASEEAKKQRSLKKFGKQVQHATLQERAKQKRETLDKLDQIKKRKRGTDMVGDDEFNIALEDAEDLERKNKRAKPNGKRRAKDSKYGSGGMKRFLRKNDAKLSADVSGANGKRKQQRPGKSRRRH